MDRRRDRQGARCAPLGRAPLTHIPGGAGARAPRGPGLPGEGGLPGYELRGALRVAPRRGRKAIHEWGLDAAPAARRGAARHGRGRGCMTPPRRGATRAAAVYIGVMSTICGPVGFGTGWFGSLSKRRR